MTRALAEAQRDGAAGADSARPAGQRPTTSRMPVRFLASPAAGYITGATLHVNGGMYMT